MRSLIVLTAACASLSGCAVLGRPARSDPLPTPVSRAQTTHELATPVPRQSVAGRGAVTPEQAIRRFAGAYINWTADSVGRDMARLAAASIGQARSALQLAAAQTAGDYELRRGGITNSGAVEAVALLPGSHGEYLVVTRESTTATADAAYRGLRPAWHVTIATVTRLQGGWVLSGWQPES